MGGVHTAVPSSARPHRHRALGFATAVVLGLGLHSSTPPAALKSARLTAAPAGIANVQIGPIVTGNPPPGNSITGTLPAPSGSGDLLIAELSNDPAAAFTAPAGWIQAATESQSGNGRVDIYYYPNSPAGIGSATFTSAPGIGYMGVELSEWSGVSTSSALDQTGVAIGADNSTNVTVTTMGPTVVGNELAVTSITTPTPGPAYKAGAGWTHIFASSSTAWASAYRLGVPASPKLSATETFNPAPTKSFALMATFKPAPLPSITSLATSPDPARPGQAVTLSATVTGSGASPTGTVTYYDGGTVIGTLALVGGTAHLTTSSLSVGSHSMTARYRGDQTYSGSVSTAVVQTVTPQSSPPPATASPAPGGNPPAPTPTSTSTPTPTPGAPSNSGAAADASGTGQPPPQGSSDGNSYAVASSVLGVASQPPPIHLTDTPIADLIPGLSLARHPAIWASVVAFVLLTFASLLYRGRRRIAGAQLSPWQQPTRADLPPGADR